MHMPSTGNQGQFKGILTILLFLSVLSRGEGATIFWIGGSGDWRDLSHWSGGTLPSLADDVILESGGDISVTNSAGTVAVKSIVSRQPLVVAGGTIIVSNLLQSDQNLLLIDGRIQGTTITTTNGARMYAYQAGAQPPILDGVTLNGELDVTGYSAHLTIVNGLKLNGNIYVGTQADTTYAGTLRITGTQTLSGNGTIRLGLRACNQLLVTDPGTTLTIGSGITVLGLGGYNGFGVCGTVAPGVSVVNEGTITSSDGGTILISSQNFTNHGTLVARRGALDIRGLRGPVGNAVVTNGGHLILAGTYIIDQDRNLVDSALTLAGNWTNTASIVLSNATLSLTNGSWENSGTIVTKNSTISLAGSSSRMGDFIVSNSVVNIDGLFSSTQIQSIAYSPNSIRIRRNGIVDNRDQTLVLDSRTGYWELTDGTLRGGRVVTTNNVRLRAGRSSSASRFDPISTLDGVILRGELEVSGDSTPLSIVNGLELNGVAYIGADPDYGNVLYFKDSQALSGSGTILIGTSGDKCSGILAAWDGDSIGATLTIGSNVTIRTLGGASRIGSGGCALDVADVRVVNQGIIRAESGLLSVNGQEFRNLGVLQSKGGAIDVTVTNLVNQGVFLSEIGRMDIRHSQGLLGRLLASAGSIRIAGASTNTTDLQIGTGGSVQILGSYELDDVHGLDLQAGGTMQLIGDLFSMSQTPALISISGSVQFSGGGNALSPRFLEAMSRDQGQKLVGFASGFALGALVVSNRTYLRLVDSFDNSPEAQPEAVYVNSLVVHSGSILDLSGLNLYTRSLQTNGSIVGGVPFLIPDGGAITQGRLTPGYLSLPGELDEWTFYGRKGGSVAVLIETGGPETQPPQLGFAVTEVIDPFDRTVATGTNAILGEKLILADVPLLHDGSYRVRVRAPDSRATGTGNYLITVLDLTPDESPLVLNQTTYGSIETPLSVDRWTFSAAEGQQVQFKLKNASSPGVAFTLRGPNGWIGFSNLVHVSELISLPISGAYTLTAFSPNGAHDIDYAFQLLETVQTELVIGETHTGQLIGSGQAMLFRIHVTGDKPIRVLMENSGVGNRTELYAGFGLPPTRGKFDYADNQGILPTRQILVDRVYAGIYYVLIYADHIQTPGDFSLRVRSADFFVTKLTPEQGGNGGTTIVALDGVGLPSSSQVRLEGNGISLPASSMTWISSANIIAELNLLNVPAGDYEILVSSGGTVAKLPFKVGGGLAAKFVAELITPTGISFNAPQTLYVEYANVGSLPMVAPLLAVRGESRCFVTPHFTLNQAELTRDFWAASQPTVSDSVVSFFATGKVPGVLLPGEKARVPVHYMGVANTVSPISIPRNARIVGWRVVNDGGGFSGCGFKFSLLQYIPPSALNVGTDQAQPDRPLDWSNLRTNIPAHIHPSAWEAIWMNWTNSVGGTVYSFFGMLEQNVRYLGNLGYLGNSLSKANDLMTFELAQCDGLHILRTLATATDAYAPTPGLRLAVDRSFGNTISSRYRFGSFGWGWSHNFEERLVKNSLGDVTILGRHGSQRVFKPDLRGGYLPALGEYGRLVSLPGNTFRLQEKGGLVREFRSDGRLNSISDPNGNRITCSYALGLLTALKHSSGQELSFTYNARGLIRSIADPVGRTTRFTYDATGEHLAAAEYYDGRVLRYQYTTGQNAQCEHALTAIELPDHSHQYFTYNAQGRLGSTSRDGGSARTTYTYDNAGTVFTTDLFNNTSQFSFDARGLLAQMRNPKGELVKLTHDERFNLTGLIDPAGRSFNYDNDRHGDLTQITDPMGNVTRFAYEPRFHRLSLLIDANGNPTLYHHDMRGNLTGITDAAGKTENWGYHPNGSPNTWTNRRRQGIQYQFNPTNGLLLAKLYPDGSRAHYEYDLRGNLTAASNYTGRVTLDYYLNNDRLKRITYPGDLWLEYTYDDAGRRRAMTDQLGYELRYDYDTLGRLRSITNSDNIRIVLYDYDLAGRMALKTLGNGVFTTYTYDTANRLEKLTNALANGLILSFFNYGYDNRGRRTTMSTHYGTWTFGYDDLGQLTNAVLVSIDPQVPNQDLTYFYDAMGNRLRTVENGVITAYAANSLNQYTQVGAVSFLFDNAGNIEAEAAAQRISKFSFDMENRLIGVSKDGNVWDYGYDAIGNRSRSAENGIPSWFVVDLTGFGNIVGEYNDAGGLIARYNFGFGLLSKLDESDGLGYYTFDAARSVQQVIRGTGAIQNSYAYSPFGELLFEGKSIPDRFAFVGELGVACEPNGLSFMRTRHYRSTLGRFISADPIGLAGGDANLYRYVGNNPVSNSDPLGLSGDVLGLGWAYAGAINEMNQEGRIPSSILLSSVSGWDCVKQAGILAEKLKGRGLDETWDIKTRDTIDFTPDYSAFGYKLSFHEWVEVTAKGDPNLSFWLDPWLGIVVPNPVTFPSLLSDLIAKIDSDTAYTQSLIPIFSFDPNQKLVLTRHEAQGYISSNVLLPYHIDFENDTNATAAAQSVFVADRLTNTLDWTTFELGEIGFGDERIMLPPQTQHFETNLPVTINGASFVVQIQAGIRLNSGEVFCTFRSIDLTTDLPPPATSGFLPPEDGTGRGQGHLTFFVRPKSGLPTGTEIRNVALVDFDGRETITTDQVDPHNPGLGVDPNKQARVTIDAGAPTSAVIGLPTESGRAFWVRWSGQDDAGGSGIASYDIFVSTNAGPFGRWLQGTTATSNAFFGELGKDYGFYCIARDLVGNEEHPPAFDQARTTVITDAPMLATVVDQVVGVGESLAISNSIVGLDPTQFIWRLGIPSLGASINPSNGVLRWTPTCSQGSTTNLITIWATERARPNISAAIKVNLTVKECVAPQLARIVLATGETGRVPLDLISSVALTNMMTLVEFPTNHFLHLGVELISTQVCWASIVHTNEFPSIDPLETSSDLERYMVTVSACTNQSLIGTQQVAWLVLTAMTNQPSAFVPVAIGPSVGIQLDGQSATNYFTRSSTIVVVGDKPLLEAVPSTNHLVQVILYSPRGVTNSIETRFDLPPIGSWQPWREVVATNLFVPLESFHPTHQLQLLRAVRPEKAARGSEP